jgi:hypothetical protein
MNELASTISFAYNLVPIAGGMKGEESTELRFMGDSLSFALEAVNNSCKLFEDFISQNHVVLGCKGEGMVIPR